MGLKTSEIAQLAAGAIGAVQLLVKLKSEGLGPLRETEETWSGAVPELITVSVWAAPEVPSVIVGNEGTVGEKVIAATGATPVPLRAKVCGLFGASSEIVTVAERTPGARGVKVTMTVQAELTAIAELQVGLEELKSLAFVPPRTTLVMCNAAVPEFFTEKFSDVLVPCVTLSKSRLAGMSVTAGTEVTPVPLRARVCGLSGASSVIMTVAERRPEASGVNVTIIVQVELTAIAELHVGLEEL